MRTSKTLMIKEHLESSVLFHTFIETKGVRIYWIWGFGVYSILGNTWSSWSSWSTCWECICENIFNSDQELRKSHSVVVWLCVWFLWILHSIFTQTSCCLSVSQLSHCSLSAFSQQTLSSLSAVPQSLRFKMTFMISSGYPNVTFFSSFLKTFLNVQNDILHDIHSDTLFFKRPTQ